MCWRWWWMLEWNNLEGNQFPRQISAPVFPSPCPSSSPTINYRNSASGSSTASIDYGRDFPIFAAIIIGVRTALLIAIVCIAVWRRWRHNICSRITNYATSIPSTTKTNRGTDKVYQTFIVHMPMYITYDRGYSSSPCCRSKRTGTVDSISVEKTFPEAWPRENEIESLNSYFKEINAT